MKLLMFVVFLISGNLFSGFAQTPTNTPFPQPTPNQREIVESQMLDQWRRVSENERINAISREKGTKDGKVSSRTNTTLPQPIRKKPTKAQRAILEPSAADAAAYAQFLAQPNTRIFRLLPDADCDTAVYVIDASRECLSQIPESAYYSFRTREHTAQYLSDIRLFNGVLYSDGLLAQSVFVSLGNVPLESVSINSDVLKFINEYQPQSLDSDALKQFNEMKRGIKAGEYFYRKSQVAEENTTYALRVIAYRGKLYRVFNKFRYNLINGDNRIDLTVAFRILRKEKDGSLLIIWKELTRGEAPKIKRSKRN